MMKMKNVIIGIVCALLVNPISASNTEQKVLTELTLDKAIESAISREEKISVLEKKIRAYDEKSKVIDDPTSANYYSNTYSRDNASQQKDLIQDVVTYNVTVLYDAITIMKKQIELNDQSIELAGKTLKQATIKNKVGLMSQYDLAQVESQLDQELAQKDKNVIALNNYKNQFLTLTGLNVDDYSDLVVDLSYEPIDEQIDSRITWGVGYYMENTDKFLEYQRNHIIEVTQATYGEGGLPVDLVYDTEATVAESSYNASQKKKNLLETLKAGKAELEKLQHTIKIQDTTIKNQKADLTRVQIKEQNGYATGMDVQKAEQSIAKLEFEKMQSIYSYREQKIVLEKPWVKY